MAGWLRPDELLDSIYDIDIEKLAQQRIRALLIDLDNTLLPWRGSVVTLELRDWVKRVKESGMALCIVSNNWGERVQKIAKELGIEAIGSAGKPRRKGFRRALKQLGLQASEAVVIGDQIFTDIWGGNRLKVRTILIAPVSSVEFIGTRMTRILERFVLKSLRLTHRTGGGNKL